MAQARAARREMQGEGADVRLEGPGQSEPGHGAR